MKEISKKMEDQNHDIQQLKDSMTALDGLLSNDFKKMRQRFDQMQQAISRKQDAAAP